MDLGIEGRWALVCASSKGLGRGCAAALVGEGVNVVINARESQPLEASARELRSLGRNAQVITVVGDIACEKVRVAILAACPQVDILINNAGGPPPGDFRDLSTDDWLAALQANMLAPIELIKATVDGMASRGFGRVINITSNAVKAPVDVLALSNGARSGLTGFVAGLARLPRLAERNVTINNLLPGAFDTDRLQQTLTASAANKGQDIDAAGIARKQTIPARRFGTADEFGAFCAFLCSQHAGYFTGQNVLIDGGAYPGVY